MSKKGKFVDICTLEDLTALVNHNFQAFEKRVAKLSRKSSMLTVLAVAAVVGVYARRRRTGSGRNRSTSFRSV